MTASDTTPDTAALSSGRPAPSAYTRFVAALPMSLRRRVRFYRTFGRLPSLRNPRTFPEKVTWRIVYDRRDVLRDTCDKARMKAHAQRTAPGEVRVPALRWQGVDLRELADVELPEHWVLKPNHRTGLVLFGSGRPDVDDLTRRTQGWLQPLEWVTGGEWAYSQADPTLIVEDRIGAPGDVLTDYKFYVFDGLVRLVQTDTDRFASHGSRHYSPGWDYRGATDRFPAGPPVPRPERLDLMLEAAAAIGAGFDFIRVDLYQHEGVVWFGEITPYPGSGLVGLEDPELEREMGDYWQLPG